MPYYAPSLVKETTTTTGTGNYTLGGAATGFRTFSSAIVPGSGSHVNNAYVPYVARMGSEYEIGLGILSASTTLQRHVIFESSNADAAVSWAAGTKEIYCELGGLSETRGRHNLVAEAHPTSSDDATDGYAPGSLWVTDGFTDANMAGGSAQARAYICVNSFPSSAVWLPIAGSHLKMVNNSAGNPMNYTLQLGGFNTHVSTKNGIFTAVVVGDAAEVAHDNSFTHGFGWDSAQSAEGGHQSFVVGQVGYTTDATPTAIYIAGDNTNHFLVPLSCAWFIETRVVAHVNGGDAKTWLLEATVKRGSSGDPSIVDTVTKTVKHDDAGASTWDVDLTIDTTNDAITITVTGQAATNINWTAEHRVVQAATR